jgi:hypothetical protein
LKKKTRYAKCVLGVSIFPLFTLIRLNYISFCINFCIHPEELSPQGMIQWKEVQYFAKMYRDQ